MATAVLIPAKTRPGVVYPHAQWYFLLAIVITWVGFARSYFAVIRTEPLLHHIHGALMGGWIALLIVQPILYQRGKFRLHRTLGRWGAFVLMPAMLGIGFLMIRRMLRGHDMPPFCRGVAGVSGCELAFRTAAVCGDGDLYREASAGACAMDQLHGGDADAAGAGAGVADSADVPA